MLKGRNRQSTENSPALPADQVQDIFDAISDLRGEMVTNKTFEAYKSKTNEQIAEMEVKISRHQKDIALLMKMPMGGTNSVVERLPTDNSDVMRFIEVLQGQISSLQVKSEAETNHNSLLQKITDLD